VQGTVVLPLYLFDDLVSADSSLQIAKQREDRKKLTGRHDLEGVEFNLGCVKPQVIKGILLRRLVVVKPPDKSTISGRRLLFWVHLHQSEDPSHMPC